ncbi:MinD/ParA family ATP-binding protein [Cellulomonas soli]
MTERTGSQAPTPAAAPEAPTGTGAVAAVTLAVTAAGRTPTIRAEVRDDGTGELSVDGVVQQVRAGSLAEAGAAVTARIAELAAASGHALPAEIRDSDGLWSLLIHPDGTVDEAPRVGRDVAPDEAGVPGAATSARPGATAPAPTTAAGRTGTAGLSAATSTAARPGAPGAATSAATGPTATVTAAAGRREAPPVSGSLVLPTLDDLLATRHAVSDGPAEEGWRGTVRRLTGGRWAPHPGPAERRRRGEVASVRRSLDGPRTIVVLNPKGGAHKTTATMLLAATFGLQRGGYTLAWDNNETRGTLGWRSSHADHTRTAVDLLQALPSLTARGTVRIGDLDQFVRTQPTEQFDVLASDEDAASAALFDARSFSELHSILSRFYRVLVVDTGNNMRASNWQAAIDVADQPGDRLDGP